MLGVGVLYMLLGVFCLRGLRDRTQREEQEEMESIEDLIAKETHT
jgi:hypothetical protein